MDCRFLVDSHLLHFKTVSWDDAAALKEMTVFIKELKLNLKAKLN